MKERPILFSAPMVRAILDGSKTQTRRVVKPQPFAGKSADEMREFFIKKGALGRDESLTDLVNGARNAGFIDVKCPHGKPGDRLWVREAHQIDCDGEGNPIFTLYRADYAERDLAPGWRPSIHMPQWASRITLEITAVRVERLQDISRGDCMAEGCPFPNIANETDPKKWYADLWNTINGNGAWDKNPWVWVVEFKQVKP